MSIRRVRKLSCTVILLAHQPNFRHWDLIPSAALAQFESFAVSKDVIRKPLAERQGTLGELFDAHKADYEAAGKRGWVNEIRSYRSALFGYGMRCDKSPIMDAVSLKFDIPFNPVKMKCANAIPTVNIFFRTSAMRNNWQSGPKKNTQSLFKNANAFFVNATLSENIRRYRDRTNME
ncbi:MAG TPA: hypothetical protein VJY99_16395 [Buttiauxella sp.]|uniref:hypothetical protein n=1 Tax=Buttiauxella sp. TaxID=1972222 RepID=UPI002B46716E|nr:hypothetical protein [Buttiauxella sp.]HKM98251.1 hypothetical protein [Buttiauxella sp.]